MQLSRLKITNLIILFAWFAHRAGYQRRTASPNQVTSLIHGNGLQVHTTPWHQIPFPTKEGTPVPVRAAVAAVVEQCPAHDHTPKAAVWSIMAAWN